MSAIEYKEFETVDNFIKLYLPTYSNGKFFNLITNKFFWKYDLGLNSFFVSKYKNEKTFKKSNLFFISTGYTPPVMTYFTINGNKIYIITVNFIEIGCNVMEFENKLYHLTHGPKAISIPDAFRILSL